MKIGDPCSLFVGTHYGTGRVVSTDGVTACVAVEADKHLRNVYGHSLYELYWVPVDQVHTMVAAGNAVAA